MSIHIDPKAVHTFAAEAATRSADLLRLRTKVELADTTLGSFEEARGLVAAINAHTSDVNQRLHATSQALLGLSDAAAHAATLSGASDAEIARHMKQINHQARRVSLRRASST